MKCTSIIALGLLVLVALFHATAGQVILTNGRLTATLTPAGGALAITEVSGNITRTFNLQTRLLTESSGNTAVSSLSSLIRETYVANEAVGDSYQDVKTTSATMFVDVAMDGASSNSSSTLSFAIKVSVFQQEGTVKLGAKKYPVDTGMLAITYTILDYPFESYDNTLSVRSTIATPSAGGSMSGNELFLYNGASWTFSSTAAIPAPYDSSPVTVKSSNTDSGVDVTMQFYASNSLTFETLWSVENPSSSATRLTSFLSFLF